MQLLLKCWLKNTSLGPYYLFLLSFPPTPDLELHNVLFLAFLMYFLIFEEKEIMGPLESKDRFPY